MSKFHPKRKESHTAVQRFKPEKDKNGDIVQRKLLGTSKEFEKGKKIVRAREKEQRDLEKEHERRMKALMRAQTNKDVLDSKPRKKRVGSNAGMSSSRGS